MQTSRAARSRKRLLDRRRRGQEAVPANGRAGGRRNQRRRGACRGHVARGAALMLFLSTRHREKATRGFKLLSVNKMLL